CDFSLELQQQPTCSYAIHTATRSTAAPRASGLFGSLCRKPGPALVTTFGRKIWTIDEFYALARRCWNGQADPASGHATGVDPYLARRNRDRTFAAEFQSRYHCGISKIDSAIRAVRRRACGARRGPDHCCGCT